MCSRGHACDCVNIRSKHTEVMIYEWFSCDFTPWTGVSVVGRGVAIWVQSFGLLLPGP